MKEYKCIKGHDLCSTMYPNEYCRYCEVKPIDQFSGDNRFLSNFYWSKVFYDGIIYPSAEHAYQAAKTNDYKIKKFIANLSTPNKAKEFGKGLILNADKKAWYKNSLLIMENVVWNKFCENTNLLDKLLDTYPAELIEGNYWNDTFWGVCNGKGENHLGKILMKVRQELKELISFLEEHKKKT